jgi:hypothetical protein
METDLQRLNEMITRLLTVAKLDAANALQSQVRVNQGNRGPCGGPGRPRGSESSSQCCRECSSQRREVHQPRHRSRGCPSSYSGDYFQRGHHLSARPWERRTGRGSAPGVLPSAAWSGAPVSRQGLRFSTVSPLDAEDGDEQRGGRFPRVPSMPKFLWSVDHYT